MTHLFVINSRGEKELFSSNKIYRSAKKSGVSSITARKIAEVIKKKSYPGIRTSEISKTTKRLLKKQVPGAALRFNLKEAMRKLGPTGFPFEKYIKNILVSFGYEVKINQFVPGKCISSYEIDFLARKGNILYVGECKYRQRFGDRIHYHEALTNYARFLDILNGDYFKRERLVIKSMLVTNTKFSERSKTYCQCVGTELLGWNYPKGRGLEYYIDKEKLYPITIFSSLKGHLKEVFVQEKMILANYLLRMDIKKFAKKHKIALKQLEVLKRQAESLLK